MRTFIKGLNAPIIESGTWTPTIQDGSQSDGEGQTYATQQGHYTKIGNRVLVTGYIQITSLGTLSGSVLLAGLPYTSSSSSQAGVVTISHFVGVSITAGQSIVGRVSQGTNYIQLELTDSATQTTSLQATELSTAVLTFSAEYTT